ncbi:phosphoribosylglycinamide formyltransferase [Candidatus Woesearchaeota archaeon]|nr:phosphoribosylglycinamide formyltransferase [Candidatus Woesearchaeota archaeon]
MMELNIGFIASHNGTNVRAIIENIEKGALDAKAKVIITNNHDAGVLEIAKEKGIPHYCLNAKNIPAGYGSLDKAMLGILRSHGVTLVLLAGYMKKTGPLTLNAYHNRILNIHPSLIPKYTGKGMYGSNVHKAVIESKDKETGVTVHIVNEDYDKGKILAQCRIPRFQKDTVKTLSSRVLRFEHMLYSQVLIDIKDGLIELDMD